jgi:signal transduction histidine kinase
VRRPSIRALLLGANAALVVLPLLALAGLRVYDVFLLRQTERQLLAESAVVAEAFREAFRKEAGVAQDEHRPPGHGDEPYAPVEPILDLGVRVLPAQSAALRPGPAGEDTPARRAGAAIEPLLRRAQTFNLSALRVLDARGCVVATTRSEAGLCMDALPEVEQALRGRYAAVARERISDEPAPPLGGVRRRGSVRVFTALPVFSDGRVIAVVRASRTGLDALSTLWMNRRGLLLSGLALGVFAAAVSLVFSAAIARPLRKLTHAARAVANGEPAERLTTAGFAPAEVAVLAGVLQQMTDRLRERAAYVTEFATHASHELKTPITAIRGAAELLQQSWQEMDAAQRQRFLANMIDDAERMERLVRRLLELAQIESAPLEPTALLQVQPFVARVLTRYGDAVRLSVGEGMPDTIAISEAHLHSVLTNLIDNALRHGGGQPVEVTLGQNAGRLTIAVRDRGAGISEAHRKRLFQRFFTTERDRGGTGLGLAIVKAIADARGGRVEVESGAGGSTFRVVL